MRKVLIAAGVATALLAGCNTTPDNSANTAAAPEDPRTATIGQAIASIKAGNYADAETALQSVLAEDPNDPYANLNMGVLKAIVDQKDQARQFYQVAIRTGGSAPMNKTVTANGVESTVSTTVAAVARENVSRL